MISAKELMVGNLLQRNGVVFRVNDIFGASGLVTMYPTEGGESYEKKTVDDYGGIPITAEILSDWCGMKETIGSDEQEYEITIFRQTYRAVLAQGTDWLLLWQEDVGCGFEPLRFIDYLHELQNIIFWTTTGNVELEIKIPIKK